MSLMKIMPSTILFAGSSAKPLLVALFGVFCRVHLTARAHFTTSELIARDASSQAVHAPLLIGSAVLSGRVMTFFKRAYFKTVETGCVAYSKLVPAAFAGVLLTRLPVTAASLSDAFAQALSTLINPVKRPSNPVGGLFALGFKGRTDDRQFQLAQSSIPLG